MYSGAAAAAAFASEDAFEVIRVFERREVPGGTWYADPASLRLPEDYPNNIVGYTTLIQEISQSNLGSFPPKSIPL